MSSTRSKLEQIVASFATLENPPRHDYDANTDSETA